MIDQSRHTPLRTDRWDPAEVAKAIEEIVSDAITHFDTERFWLAHPLDDGLEDGNSNIYFGAAGMIWALDYLSRTGATKSTYDFSSTLAPLLEKTKAEMGAMGAYGKHGSLLFGDLGTALVIMRIAPSQVTAELIESRCLANAELPIRELMWGTPGSMLACINMAGMTGEKRWRKIFEVQAERLLGDLKEATGSPIWIQNLYGKHARFLGAVHGYAGNMIPLMRGWDWLTDAQQERVADAVPRTLNATAWRSDLGASWQATVPDEKPPRLCQHCHGAPGMVTTFADAPFASPEFEELLLEGGKFTWAAGPLAKGSNLCHGTAGNGYAFLKLYRRTSDEIWLERARAFAMTAIAQCREDRMQLGRGRYSLWTGDVGVAIYLWHCLTQTPHFPSVDAF